MVERIAWTLIHFVWEGTVLAALLALLLWATRRGTASLRYGLSCAGLVLLVACPVATFLQLANPDVAPLTALPQAAHSHFTMGETIVAESSVFPLVVQIWAIGVALLSVRFIGTLIHVERWKRRHTRPAEADWQARIDVLAQRMGINRGIRLLVSDRIGVPSAWGVLKSVVVLPASLLSQLSPAQIETILLHELAHIRRHDYLVNLLQTVVETALFYHPAVWWISSVVRRERENCCDDVVVNSLADPMPYARALLQLEERRTMLPHPTLSAKGSNLMNRIARILGAKPAPIRISPLTSTMATLAVLAAVMGGTLQAQAQSPKPKPVPPKVKAKSKHKTSVTVRPIASVKVMAPKPSPVAKPAPVPKPSPAAKPVPVAKVALPAPATPPRLAKSSPPRRAAKPAPPLLLVVPTVAPKPPRVDPTDPIKSINTPIAVAPATRVTANVPLNIVEAANVTISSTPTTASVAPSVNSVVSITQSSPATSSINLVIGKDPARQIATTNYISAKTLYGKVGATQTAPSTLTYVKSLYGKANYDSITSKAPYRTLGSLQTMPSTLAYTKSIYGKFIPLSKANVTLAPFGVQNRSINSNVAGKSVFGSQNPFAGNKWNAKGGTVFGATGVQGFGTKNFDPFQGARAFTGNSFFGEGEISIEVKGGSVSLDVKDARLASTLRKLAKQAKLSVVINPGRYEDVTLVLSDISPTKALEIICRAAGAAYRLEGGVYYISPRSGGISATSK